MNTKLLIGSFIAISLSLTSCKGDHSDVVKEQREAQHEINDAQLKVEDQRAKNAERINEAVNSGNPEKINDAKVEATKDLAEAHKKVEDEKIEATNEITKAQKDAGESTGMLRKE